MRARQLLLGIGAFAALAIAGFGGCGGSSTDTPADAGSDTTVDAPADRAADVTPDIQDSGPVCAEDADISKYDPADAALNDAGANTQGCAKCIKSDCKTEVTACNDNCECRTAVVAFYTCLAKGGSLQACGIQAFGGLSGEAQQLGQDLGFCVYGFCKDECGVPDLPDGGFDAARDAPDGG
jgi:hypothetical protein